METKYSCTECSIKFQEYEGRLYCPHCDADSLAYEPISYCRDLHGTCEPDERCDCGWPIMPVRYIEPKYGMEDIFDLLPASIEVKGIRFKLFLEKNSMFLEQSEEYRIEWAVGYKTPTTSCYYYAGNSLKEVLDKLYCVLKKHDKI